MDKFVVTLAAVSQRIEHAKALRIVDASTRRLPLQKKIGAGLNIDEFRRQVAAGAIKHVGLPESVAMVADTLNLPVDQISLNFAKIEWDYKVQDEKGQLKPGATAGYDVKSMKFSINIDWSNPKSKEKFSTLFKEIQDSVPQNLQMDLFPNQASKGGTMVREQA